MEQIYLLLIAAFTCCLLFIFIYSIAQIQLVFRYLKKQRESKEYSHIESKPTVCIQLPIYNEQYVSTRLVDAVAKIQYPRELFSIQVLDDSTDETQEILKSKVDELKNTGLNIDYVHRTDRKGFKAGALREGLNKTNAEIVGIFDADFIPKDSFLEETIPHFADKNVGMVQTCWDHLNKNYSLLTKLQAFGLDAHFSIEQVGRNAKNNFINFNGTGGLWRKECILDAGNWEADTLTEDLDLSYRAQLKNWRFVYLEEVKSPAELPPVMSALRSQQYRWTKGGAETAKKHLKTVLTSEKPWSDKWHGVFHLLNSSIFVCILFSGLASLPILILKQQFPAYNHLYVYASFFLFSFLSISMLYAVSSVSRFENKRKGLGYFFTHYPLFLSFSMGLSFHNAIAVIEGYLGKKTPFVRTPKFNLSGANDLSKNKYLSRKISPFTIVEFLLFCCFTFGLGYAIWYRDFSMFFYHGLLTIGFGLVTLYSLKREH